MYSDAEKLANEQNYRLRRQEAIREARETAARSQFNNINSTITEASSIAVSSLKDFIRKIEIDDIVLIGLFFIILDEGIEENIVALALIAILFFTD